MDKIENKHEPELSLDSEVIEKFKKVLNDESLLNAGTVAHQSNNHNA